MDELFDADGVRAKLALMVKGFGQLQASQNDVARMIGVNKSHLSRVLRGECAPGPKILGWLGMEEVPRYRYILEGRKRKRRNSESPKEC